MNRCIKKVLLAANIIVAGALFAQEVSPRKELTPEERTERYQKMMERTGGIIDMPGTGKLLYVNCQSRVVESEVSNRVEKIKRTLKFNTELRQGSWSLQSRNPEDATFVVYIVDDEKLPMSLVAVESRWGVVNTATLKLGNRFSKELTRVTTLVLGAAQSQIKTSPMRTVTKSSDLDQLLTDGFCPDSVNQIFGNTKALGMTRSKQSSYIRACQEGWAHAPTNQYQKAIWDKVHQLPTKPMKIKFDPKVGR